MPITMESDSVLTEPLTSQCEVNTITVSSYKNGQIHGYLYNQYLQQKTAFNSEMQLVWLLNNLMDFFSFPQSYVKPRSFWKRKCHKEDHSMDELNILQDTQQVDDESQKKSTFIVQVKYRQNASWQGTLQWVDKDKKQHFRSTLEMLILMDEAINDGLHPSGSWLE